VKHSCDWRPQGIDSIRTNVYMCRLRYVPLKIFAIELGPPTSHRQRWDQRNPASSSITMVVNMPGSVVANGMRVGIISDTHGLMRPVAIAALRGSDLIVHAGDIGRLEVLEQLRDLAPTHAEIGRASCRERV